MPSPTSDSPSLPPSDGLGGHQEPAGGSNGAREAPDPPDATQGRSELSTFGQGVLARFVIPVLADPGMARPPTPPAAPVPAAQRPEVAGEPESGQDGTAGREAARDITRRYLVPVARLDLPDQPDDTHLSVHEWLPKIEEWVTGPAICGYSTTQGALPDGAEVTCAACLEYQPEYERYLDQLGVGPDVWQAKAEAMERDRDRLALAATAAEKRRDAAERQLLDFKVAAEKAVCVGCMHREQQRTAMSKAATETGRKYVETKESARSWMQRAEAAEAQVERHVIANLEAAERAQRVIEALRLKVGDLERIAAGPKPPEQDSTGWQWLCHRCDLGADGHFTRRSARRAQRKHLHTAHR